MTYAVGLKFLVDESTSKASTAWTMSTNRVDGYKQRIRDLLGLGMAIGTAICGYMIFVGLGSLRPYV